MSLHTDTLSEIEAELERLSSDVHYEWVSGPQASSLIDDISRKLRVEIDRIKELGA